MSGRKRALWERGRKVSQGEQRAVLSWEWSPVPSSVSDRHVETRSTEEGDMKSQRTFVSSRKAEGGWRILEPSCLDNRGWKPRSQLQSVHPEPSRWRTSNCESALERSFLWGFPPWLLFEFLTQRMCQFPHKNVFESSFYFLTRYFCTGLGLVRVLTFG